MNASEVALWAALVLAIVASSVPVTLAVVAGLAAAIARPCPRCRGRLRFVGSSGVHYRTDKGRREERVSFEWCERCGRRFIGLALAGQVREATEVEWKTGVPQELADNVVLLARYPIKEGPC